MGGALELEWVRAGSGKAGGDLRLRMSPEQSGKHSSLHWPGMSKAWTRL